MSNFSKQFAIIDRIKSIVRGRNNDANKKVSDEKNISEKIACKIQNTAYEHLMAKNKKDCCTPTYIIVSEQLYVENNQIFCAAVYTLSQIAQSTKSYKKPILDILVKALKENEGNKQRYDYLSQKIADVKVIKLE